MIVLPKELVDQVPGVGGYLHVGVVVVDVVDHLDAPRSLHHVRSLGVVREHHREERQGAAYNTVIGNSKKAQVDLQNIRLHNLLQVHPITAQVVETKGGLFLEVELVAMEQVQQARPHPCLDQRSPP
eukprot:CAMPEP_0113937414 /NCGR_PEP_ID=MMETSP1339-20121228/4042_1 /TAXON_ID=94617 /ORGANISM="Fibrocapsa japonica" /LENGTH=126 /DNA_ID=CAMNT_0000940167 /DNA_START=600 /DNA_END=977 /DNA_ORIENTATION=- /assembly_acc=CAM_ASM_000762